MYGTGNRFGIGFEIEGMAQINNRETFAGVEFVFELIDSDAADAQIAKELLARDKFEGNVSGQEYKQQNEESAAQLRSFCGDIFELVRENVADAEECSGPENGAKKIENKKAAKAHVKNTGERSGDGAQAGNELGDEQRLGALFLEEAFRAAHAGIRFKGNAAKPLQNLDAFAMPELVPQRV